MIQVQDRPVTQQGMVGLQSGKRLGPARQVHDKSFFLSELRQKYQELSVVVEDMSNQIDDFNKNSNAIVILQKRDKDCEQAVKDLQGKLSDLNIILDKAGTDASQEEIQQQYLQIKVMERFPFYMLFANEFV